MSAADSLKQPASTEENPDEPSLKKAKLNTNTDQQQQEPSATDTTNKTPVEDSKNGTTATEKSLLDSKNNNNINNVPSKVANGGTIDNSNKTNEGNQADNNNDNQQEVEEVDDDDDDDDDDDSANLDGVFDPKIAKSLEEVESIQAEIFNLNEKASEEILKVEQKFNQLRRPHFEKRNELLKEIPNFWLTSLANHPTIAPMIESAEDEDCLHYMINLDVEEFEDIKSGYRLKFQFKENPYINNTIIVKEFQVVSPEEISSNSTTLEYKKTQEGDSLKFVVEQSLAQERSNKTRRPDDQRHQSFFAWLVDSSESGQDEIAEILKDQIWPNPLELFFATPQDDYDVGSEDDESDDEDEEIGEEIIAGGIEFDDEEIEGEEEDEDEDDEDDDEEEDDDEDDEGL